jgi:hypothetical protein
MLKTGELGKCQTNSMVYILSDINALGKGVCDNLQSTPFVTGPFPINNVDVT